ncbi:MAG: RNA polymerase sigma factor [Sedimentisphaerales bacterium]|nr:RNA polymerase sigma factor [Sedimentisphaerales bacterium]
MTSSASIIAVMKGGVIEAAEQSSHPASGTESLQTRLAAGDAAAFDELIAQYAPQTARLSQRLLNWRADLAEDVVQDVFMAVWTHRRKFRGDCSLATWITRITVNQCRSYRRRHLLAFRRQKEVIETQRQAGDDTPPDFVRAEQSRRIRQCIARLPNPWREVVVLRYLEEMPIGQIAEALKVNTNIVNMRLSRARQRLREMPEMAMIKE